MGKDVAELAAISASIQLGLNPFRSNRENTLNLVISGSNRENVLKWIARSDLCSSSHKAARKQCQLGTGNWFLQGQIYQNWRKKPGSFLWLHGIPGCGKTILWIVKNSLFWGLTKCLQFFNHRGNLSVLLYTGKPPRGIFLYQFQ
jgi:hypothetical protein